MNTNNEKPSWPAPRNDDLATHTIRAFLADDSPFILSVLARILAKDKRITIVGSASDGRQAFQCACMSRPDLVLIDLHMAGSDSVEIARWLKQLRNPPIVIVVTSDDSTISRARSLAAGADAFLLKTEDLDVQLQSTIRKFFDKWYRKECSAAEASQ
jgi:DNA-binding NarL/FixJ family response regulator